MVRLQTRDITSSVCLYKRMVIRWSSHIGGRQRHFRVYDEAPGLRPGTHETDASACLCRRQAFALTPVRESENGRRHQAFALDPVTYLSRATTNVCAGKLYDMPLLRAAGCVAVGAGERAGAYTRPLFGLT